MPSKERQLNQVLAQFYQKPVAKVSLELVFSIIMVTVFAFFAIRPTLLTMADLVKEIQDKQALNQALAQKAASLSSVQQIYIGAQSRLAILDEAIPSSPHFYDALVIIEKLASEHNLTIVQVQANDIPKENVSSTQSASITPITRLSRPISVSIVGDYPAIRAFVEDLRNIRRTMVVDSIVFTLLDERGKKQLHATVTISIQYFGSQKN